jgi:hypothetical protein
MKRVFVVLIPCITIFIITNEFMSKYLILSFPLVGNLSEGRRILDKPE